MTTYREGQRVRVTFEGELIRGDITGALYVADSGGIALLNGHDGPTRSAEAATSIEILAEPKPDEPKGVGAVVRGPGGVRDLWVRVHAGPVRPWHEVLPGTYEEHDACRRTWDQIEVVEVLSPGVDVDALDVIDAEVL